MTNLPNVSEAVERVKAALARAEDLGIERSLFGRQGPGLVMSDLTTLLADHSRLSAANAHWADMANEVADDLLARAESAEAKLADALVALRPFAKFDLNGFDGIVLEVVPSSPTNPARRIEPILSHYFRLAAHTFARLSGDPEPGASTSPAEAGCQAAMAPTVRTSSGVEE
jgi:hypothetical protein